MTERAEAGGLRIARPLHALIQDEIAPGTDIDPQGFWSALATIVRDLAPRTRVLLAKRDSLQRQIDVWHREHPGPISDPVAYKGFLEEIGYLAPEGDAFTAATDRVDPEIAQVAGPQLVVPVDNARYALNAANARWGSLYDALYGTDVIPEGEGAARGDKYNPVRGARVVDYANGPSPRGTTSRSRGTASRIDD